eukprot:scaffold24569_cov57-Phaeocystis_antarctica.AAC.2
MSNWGVRWGGERGVKKGARHAWRVCGVCGLHTRLAAGVAVLLGDPIGERLPIVRGAAGSDGRVGHGGHSDGADKSGRDWRRRRNALDAEGRRPEGLRLWGFANDRPARGRGGGIGGGGGGGGDGGEWLNPPRRLDELLPETPDLPDKAAVQEEPH